MDLERQLGIRELNRDPRAELGSMMSASEDTTAPPAELLMSLVEVADLQNELEFLRGDSADSDAPDAYIMAPLKPAPALNSGSVALPEPDSGDF